MCGIVGGINTKGGMLKGSDFIDAISIQHERGNGLGGGFAVYGIYPDLKDYYALHIACENESIAESADEYIRAHLYVKIAEDIPTKDIKPISWHPILKRYFVLPGPNNEDIKLLNIDPTSMNLKDEYVESYMKSFVFDFNQSIDGAFVMSCGKDMGVFKGVGYPEDIGEFYLIDKMQGSIWLVHNRFPTNSQSWWGGAHPFSLLEWSVVHNGEITSYGVNKNYLEMYGYKCRLQTDTEVISYLFDFLIRERRLSLVDTCTVLSPPLWEEIDKIRDEKKRKRIQKLRQLFPQALLNGPFAILVSNGKYLVAMNDSLKLRPLVGAQDKQNYFFSSEECSFKVLCPNRERTWQLSRGKPEIVGMMEESHEYV